MPSCNMFGQPQEPILKGDYSFNTGKIKTLSAVDYVVLIAVMGVITLYGLHIAWRNRLSKGIDDFLLVGRELPFPAAGISIAAGFISGITVIGLPGTVFTDGTMELWQIIAIPFGFAAVITLLVPAFYNLQVLSIYEYLELRFDRKVRILGSCYFIFMTLVTMSIVLYAPSLSINAVTGMSVWGSLWSVGLSCILYTALGGTRAVVYTDVFLLLSHILASIVTVIYGRIAVGDWADVWNSAVKTHRLSSIEPEHIFYLDLTHDHTALTVFISTFVYAFAMSLKQTHIHRCLCCSSDTAAKRAMWIAAHILALILMLGVIIGLYISKFYENCDPLRTRLISSSDQVYPLFVMDVMSKIPGFPGIFMAGLFSATLSTMSSGLNSIATVALEDYIRVYFWARIAKRHERLMVQVFTVFFGLICLELAVVATQLEGGIFQIDQAINGILGSPLIGVFLLGLFLPWTNEKGALWGLLGGTAFNIGVFSAKKGLNFDLSETAKTCISNCNASIFLASSLFGNTNKQPSIISPTIYATETNFLLRISSRLHGVVGVLITVLVGLIISAITGFENIQTIDPALIVPIFDEVIPLCYLPESIKKWFRFGIVHTEKWTKYRAKRELAEKSKKALRKKIEGGNISTGSDLFGPVPTQSTS